MRYVKIRADLFQDENFASLSEGEKNLFFYLYCCPHGNMAGLFKLKIGYALSDLKIKEQTFLNRMASLSSKMPIMFDRENEVIWLMEYTKENPVLMNENKIKGLIKVLREFPISPLSHDFLIKLSKQVSKGLPKGVNEVVLKELTELIDKQILKYVSDKFGTQKTVISKQKTENKEVRTLCTFPNPDPSQAPDPPKGSPNGSLRSPSAHCNEGSLIENHLSSQIDVENLLRLSSKNFAELVHRLYPEKQKRMNKGRVIDELTWLDSNKKIDRLTVLSALMRHLNSDLWKAGDIPSIYNWVSGAMWTYDTPLTKQERIAMTRERNRQ